MANIGVNENFYGYLAKASEITTVDSFLKTTTPTVGLATCEAVKQFRFRYVDMNESIAQPLPVWLKDKIGSVIFSSDTTIEPKAHDAVYTEDGRKQIIVNVYPQRQLGAYAFSKKFPHILNLE
jgi:hypothetical protein